MEIVEFEQAFRAAAADGAMQPLLATSGLSIPSNVRMPEEFQAAVRSLAGRRTMTPQQDGLLHAAAQWV